MKQNSGSIELSARDNDVLLHRLLAVAQGYQDGGDVRTAMDLYWLLAEEHQETRQAVTAKEGLWGRWPQAMSAAGRRTWLAASMSGSWQTRRADARDRVDHWRRASGLCCAATSLHGNCMGWRPTIA